MKTLILVNPQARGGEVADRWKELEAELRTALGEAGAMEDDDVIEVVFTTPEDHGAGLVARALRSGTQRVLVVGGDGTVSEALQGFFEPGAPGKAGQAIAPEAVLSVMPAGRGDDFFKSMSGHRSMSSGDAWARGLELLRKGKPRPTDVGYVEWIGAPPEVDHPRYFINIASYGFPGLVVDRVVARKGALGRSRAGKSALTYVIQSTLALLEYKPIEIEVKLDGQPFYQGRLFSGFVLNGAYNAGGVCWDESASIDDGEFSLLVTEPSDAVGLASRLRAMASGKWAGLTGIHRGKGREVEVLLPGTRKIDHSLFEIDGDQPDATLSPVTRGARFTMLHGAVRLWR